MDHHYLRSSERRVVLFETEITVDGISVICEILNISHGGAQVMVPMEASSGDTVHLKIAQLGSYRAEVIWSRERKMGLRFDDEPHRIADAVLLIATYGGA